MEKKKILVISDHVFSTSGVAHQTKEFVYALLNTGRFSFLCLGGAIKHTDYNPVKTERWGDDLIVVPVDGYGTPEVIRKIVRQFRPDLLWYMSDPRFYQELHQMIDEILPLIPVVWYTIWDNYPPPMFNRPAYLSNTHLACVSKVTYDVVKAVVPEMDVSRIPHSVDFGMFKRYPKEVVDKFKSETLGKHNANKFVFFFNSRNARRKHLGSTIFWFKEFVETPGYENSLLLCHTDPKDPNGPNIMRILEDLGLDDGRVMISNQKVPVEYVAMMYNIADCTLLLSDAEGWGLNLIESLASEVPAICTMTGGIQEQITDGKNFFGVGIKPVSITVAGSQDVPYIFEDRICKEDVLEAMKKIYDMTIEKRQNIGKLGKEYVTAKYDHETWKQTWVDLIDRVIEENGSWDTRKNYKPWELISL